MLFEATVKEMIKRTSGITSIRFSRPQEFSFQPGQFIDLELDTGDGSTRKCITISSSPTDANHIEVTKRLTGHPFSNAIASLKPGDQVRVDGPLGNFTYIGEHPKVLALTGGIGITPIISILRYCRDSKLHLDLTLLYSNKYEDDIAFKEELDSLQSLGMGLRVFYTITRPTVSWRGLTGRITNEMVRAVAPDYLDRVAYVCGPPTMVNEIVGNLVNDLGLPQRLVKTEYFTGYN